MQKEHTAANSMDVNLAGCSDRGQWVWLVLTTSFINSITLVQCTCYKKLLAKTSFGFTFFGYITSNRFISSLREKNHI